MDRSERTVKLLEQLIGSKEHLTDMLVEKGEEASFDEPFNDLVEKAGDYIPKSYLVVDEDGNEMVAVMVDQETVFTATANDVREGKTFATETGVKVGMKDIPPYYTTEAVYVVPAGREMNIKIPDENLYDYTKLQAIVCKFNTSLSNSVETEKVVINDNVYAVSSTIALSAVQKAGDTKTINLGITNTGAKPVLIRYFTYKEIY